MNSAPITIDEPDMEHHGETVRPHHRVTVFARTVSVIQAVTKAGGSADEGS